MTKGKTTTKVVKGLPKVDVNAKEVVPATVGHKFVSTNANEVASALALLRMGGNDNENLADKNLNTEIKYATELILYATSEGWMDIVVPEGAKVPTIADIEQFKKDGKWEAMMARI